MRRSNSVEDSGVVRIFLAIQKIKKIVIKK